MTDSQLNDIYAKANDQKSALYQQLADQLISKQDVAGIQTEVEHLVRKEGAEQFGRSITTAALLHIVKQLGDEKSPIALKALTPLMAKIVEVVREKGEDFPDPLMKAVGLLGECYQGAGDFKRAAYALASFKFDQYRNSSATPDEKVEWYVNTAEFFLEIGETGSATQFIRRAHNHANEIKGNTKLLVHFKTCYARVLDCERKFYEAARAYRELAQFAVGHMSESDLITTLENAVITAILANAGPQRARLLATLYADERAKNLANYSLLEKMYKERIVRPQEVKKFEGTLQTHQNAQTSTGRSVLQNAIIEHNMAAASKIYNNIRFVELGRLLGIEAKQAEELASTMIEQGRLSGIIDQIEGLIEFTEGTGSGPLAAWDSQIQDTCLLVNSTLESITKKHPEYRL